MNILPKTVLSQIMIGKIDLYLTSIGKSMKLMDCEDDYKKYTQAIKVVEELGKTIDIESYIATVKVVKDDCEAYLIRWIFYDVEFISDGRPTGRIGSTGNTDNIKKCMALLSKVEIREKETIQVNSSSTA